MASVLKVNEIQSDTSLPLVFSIDNVERARIDTSGNVGIGAASPGARLHVSGSNPAGYIANYVENTASNGYARLDLRIGSSGASGVGTVAYAPGIFMKIGPDANDTTTPLVFATNNATERMRLDASGNLGLGVTPSAWGGAGYSGRALEIGAVGNSLWGVNATNLYLMNNVYYDGAFKYASANAASRYLQQGGSHIWGTAASGTAGNAITFTQAMTLDASGGLTLGASVPALVIGSSAVSTGDCRMEIGTGRTGNGNGYIDIVSDATYTDYGLRIIRYSTGANADAQIIHRGTGALSLQTNEAAPIFFATNSTERARITSGGDFYLGNTAGIVGNEKLSISQPTSLFWAQAIQLGNTANGTLYTNTSGTASYTAVSFRNNGTTFTIVGNITVSGTTVTYGSVSDYRLKENVQPMTNALAKVAELKPCTYTWKSDGSNGEGFIAHELQSVIPSSVAGEKDSVNEDGSINPQMVDTSFIVATLTAAIQEQQAMIEEMKAEIAALKGNA